MDDDDKYLEALFKAMVQKWGTNNLRLDMTTEEVDQWAKMIEDAGNDSQERLK